MRQFLLNPDESVPNNIDRKILDPKDYILTIPTDPPKISDDSEIYDTGKPVLKDGKYYQVWATRPQVVRVPLVNIEEKLDLLTKQLEEVVNRVKKLEK